MHCPSCGTLNENGAKFCKSCGGTMPAAQQAAQAPAQFQQMAPAAAPAASKTGLYLGGGAVAIALAFGGYFLNNQKNEQIKAESAKVEALAAANVQAEQKLKELEAKKKAATAAALAAAALPKPAPTAPGAAAAYPATAVGVAAAPALGGVTAPQLALGAAPPAAAGNEWYSALKSELSRCETKSAIYGRGLCEKRAREKYCTGNYGKVPECK